MAPHPPRGKYVTVVIDLTLVRDGTGPARPLDMVEGRSKIDSDWRSRAAGPVTQALHLHALPEDGALTGEDIRTSEILGQRPPCRRERQ